MDLSELYIGEAVLNEVSVSAWMRRLWQKMTGQPTFGPGVDPSEFPEPDETVTATGVPAIDFEGEWEKAEELAKQGDAEGAYRIMKDLADKSGLTGGRSKSYLKRRFETEDRIHIVADVDNLKYLNTKLGHRGADEVLKIFNEILSQAFEDPEGRSKVYHPSGDEFGVIVNVEGMEAEDIRALVWSLYTKAKKVVNTLASKIFEGPQGKARATATLVFGFDYKSADRQAEKMKMRRRKIRPFAKAEHVGLTSDVKELLGRK